MSIQNNIATGVSSPMAANTQLTPVETPNPFPQDIIRMIFELDPDFTHARVCKDWHRAFHSDQLKQTLENYVMCVVQIPSLLVNKFASDKRDFIGQMKAVSLELSLLFKEGPNRSIVGRVTGYEEPFSTQSTVGKTKSVMRLINPLVIFVIPVIGVYYISKKRSEAKGVELTHHFAKAVGVTSVDDLFRPANIHATMMVFDHYLSTKATA